MGELKSYFCPVCKGGLMILRGEETGGFSLGKAALGVFAVGALGVAAGALGKKQKIYVCDMCGYTIKK